MIILFELLFFKLIMLINLKSIAYSTAQRTVHTNLPHAIEHMYGFR